MSFNAADDSSLVIALVALLIALFQLLQQLFAKADGYRNCQRAVMGPWSCFTKLRPQRWFRVATKYSVPKITMDKCDHQNAMFCIVGGSSRETTACPVIGNERNFNEAGEMVTWVLFLDQLHHLGSSYPESSSFDSDSQMKVETPSCVPCLRKLDRSWDLTSSDIIKPLAVSNLSSVAIMARRLGMIWTQFKPADSILRAEGSKMTITSTFIRSVGIIMAFDNSDRVKKKIPLADLYMPLREADMLGFGLLPKWFKTDEFFRVGTDDDCISTMSSLCGQEKADVLRGHIKKGWSPGFSDIIPFACPFMYRLGSGIVRVPKPSHYSIGLTVASQAFIVFEGRLTTYLKKQDSSVATQVLDWFHDLDHHELGRVGCAESWRYLRNIRSNNDQEHIYVTFLDSVCEIGKMAEARLCELEINGLTYEDLISCHVESAIEYKNEAKKRAVKGPTYNAELSGDGWWLAEGMHVYFDTVMSADFLKRMKKRGFLGEHSALIDAWILMMFRAFCWQRCHYMVGGHRVPSDFWDSLLPIYLT